MGVSKELLDRFYDLADFDEQQRHKAVLEILNEFERNASYCLERLVVGLSSSRAAARLGYTNALSFILASYGKEWSATKLFKMVDEKLPLNKAEDPGSAALGQHLFYLAMVNSDAYTEALQELVRRELNLAEKHSWLCYAVADLLARCANKLDKKKFAKGFWPLVKEKVAKDLDSLAPEWFYFIVHIMKQQSGTLKTELSYLSANGKLHISNDDYEKIIIILKKTSGYAENNLIFNLLLLARDAGNFDLVYKNIVEKWLYHGDLHKVIHRSVPFINTMLQQIDFRSDELLSIFSIEFVRMIRSLRTSNEFRFMRKSVENILLALNESLHKKEWSSANIVALLDHFDSVGHGRFDEMLSGNIKITEKIMMQLCDDAHEIISRALISGGWKLKRIAAVFPHWPVNMQGKVLKLFFKNKKWTDETRNALCACIASLFIVTVRAGRNVTVKYKADHDELIQNFIEECIKQHGFPSLCNETIAVFLNVIGVWIAATSNMDERRSYLRDYKEVKLIGEKLTESGNDDDYTVLIDLLLSLLSRPHRYHRPIVHFIFASFVPMMKLENCLHLFETINLSDEEIMHEKEESESDGESGVDGSDFEESNATTGGSGTDTDDDKSNQNEETDDSEFEGEEEVDEEFTSSLKKALGPAAASSGDESDRDSASSTVSDETMFRLDESLAAVFRKRARNSRTLSAALIEQAQQFRSKCFDLLLIATSHQDRKLKTVDFILPLIECAEKALRKRDNEYIFKKADHLMDIILKHHKEELDEKKAVELLDKLTLATSQIVNPVMRHILGNVTSFLFSACYNRKQNTVAENMRIKVIESLNQYMTNGSNHILSEIVTAPFIKYPQALLSELPRLIKFASDENVRPYQRVEALSCAVAFFRKNLMKTENPNEQKIWKKVTKLLCSYSSAYFSTLDFDSAKPRYFAYLLRVLTAFASIAEQPNKQRLKKSLAEILTKLCGDIEIQKTGNKLKRFNATSQQICGRNALGSLKQLLNILERSTVVT